MSGVRVLVDARAKWARFRSENGNTEWVGDPPLVELYSEYLDALNYLHRFEEENGRDEWTERAWQMTFELAMAVRNRLDRS